MTTGVPEPTIRVLLFGFGLAGRVFHAPLVASTPGMQLSAIVTGNPERQAQVRGQAPEAEIIASNEEALERAAEFDLAVIASANVTHLPFALTCLDAGLHVVVDKPVAADAPGAQQIADRAHAVGRLAIPFQNRRWDSDVRTLRRLLTEQPVGEVHRLESRIERMRPALKGTWRESSAPQDVGGVLIDFGAHLVDQALSLLGPVSMVQATARSTRFPGTSDDDAQILLTHVSGAISVLVSSQAAAFGGPRFTVLGTMGGIRIEAADTQEDALKAGRRPDDGVPWGREPDSSVATVRLLRDGMLQDVATVPLDPGAWNVFYPAVAAAIKDGSAPPVPIEDAVANARVLDAARASAASGAGIRLEPPAGHLSAGVRD